MAQQIEPIEIFGKENKGEYLYAYKPFSFTETKIMVVEILDKDGYSLFSSNLTAETIEEVAEKLSLTLITDTMDNRKELLTEIMEADAKDGLYEQDKNKYSEQEVLQLLLRLQQTESYDNLYDWFKQFKKQ